MTAYAGKSSVDLFWYLPADSATVNVLPAHRFYAGVLVIPTHVLVRHPEAYDPLACPLNCLIVSYWPLVAALAGDASPILGPVALCSRISSSA